MKPPLQTALKKLDDTELAALRELLDAPDRGAAAKVWALADFAKAEAARRSGETKPPPAGDDELFAAMLRRSTAARLRELSAIAGKGLRLDLTGDTAWRSAFYAAHGASPFFGDEAAEAARRGDAPFFRTCAEAVAAARAPRNAGDERGAAHLTAALLILRRATKNGAPRLAKGETRARIEAMLGRANIEPYSDRESWRKLWKRPELAAFMAQGRGA